MATKKQKTKRTPAPALFTEFEICELLDQILNTAGVKLTDDQLDEIDIKFQNFIFDVEEIASSPIDKQF